MPVSASLPAAKIIHFRHQSSFWDDFYTSLAFCKKTCRLKNIICDKLNWLRTTPLPLLLSQQAKEYDREHRRSESLVVFAKKQLIAEVTQILRRLTVCEMFVFLSVFQTYAASW